MDNIRKLVAKKMQVETELEEAIWAKMEVIARRMNLDEMLYCIYGNEYKRQGKIVVAKRLDALDDLFCEHIRAAGFQGVWTKKEGWT